MKLDNITVLDATPMMADVISGATPEPKPHHDTTHWWHWAVKTHAGRRALELIGCTVDIEHPWVKEPDGWRIQPWVNPGSVDTPPQFNNVVGRLRDALGEPAGVFFVEVSTLDTVSLEYIYSHQTMIAINIDGTRAAIAS